MTNDYTYPHSHLHTMSFLVLLCNTLMIFSNLRIMFHRRAGFTWCHNIFFKNHRHFPCSYISKIFKPLLARICRTSIRVLHHNISV